jgi:hypothetical protein
MHTLLTGVMQSGKTHSAKFIANNLRQQGYTVLVRDPNLSTWPAGCLVFSDLGAWMAEIKKWRRCALICDEAGDIREGAEINAQEYNWLTTRAHHQGHGTWLLCQRPVQLMPTLRRNCRRALVFQMDEGDAKDLGRQFCVDLSGASRLETGDHLYVRQAGKAPILQRFPSSW